MAQSEDHVTESNPIVNTTDAELPVKPKCRITSEFPLFAIMMGMSLSGTAISNIILYRTCVHSLGFPEGQCHGFLSPVRNNETIEIEAQVQRYTTTVSTVRGVIESVVPAVLSFFLGVWSDTHGRKPLIVWPIFGMTISAGLMVIYSMIDSLGPWWYIVTVIPYSLTGGYIILFTGAFCSLNDITTPETRSIRMTLLEVAVGLGSAIGSVLSSPVLRLVGHTYLILISTTLNVVAYAFANICIPESVSGAVEGTLKSVLDFSLVKEMVRDCFKKRPNFGRAQILLLTFANSLSIFIMYGLFPLDYMYTRQKLHWAMKEYTQFSAMGTLISFAGSFIGIVVLKKLLNVSDLAIPNIAYITTIVDYWIRVFATQSWQMYLGASISASKGLSSPFIRSFMTKIVPVADIAKVFALMSAIEGICPLISPVLYNSLYQFTVDTLPGAIYILSSGITAICVIFISLVQYFRWNLTSPFQVLESS